MTEPLLSVEGLAIVIGDREVVSNVQFELGAGECLGLVGETGSGKSVTCRALTGMLGRIGGRVTRGDVRLAGLNLGTLDESGWRRLRGRRIGFIPQSSLSGLNPVITIGRQLVETVKHLRSSTNARADAIELLERVQMPHAREVFDFHPHELSGGMRQRVMIALGIAGAPEILVADEPTTALDVTVQREILDLLLELRQQSGMALILVSHDLGVVSAVSDQAAVMYAGITVEVGPTSEVVERPFHPYTRALLAARPVLAGTGRRLSAIGGHPPDPGDWAPGCRFAPRCPSVLAPCAAQVPSALPLVPGRRVSCIRAAELNSTALEGRRA